MTNKRLPATRALGPLAALLWACCALAQQVPTAQELIAAAHKASDLSSAGPYALQAAVVVNPGKKNQKTGKLTVIRDHKRQRVTLEIAGQQETRIVLADREYIMPGKNLLVEAGLQNADQLWDPGRPNKFSSAYSYQYGSVTSGKVDGQAAWCVDQKTGPGNSGRQKLCFDAARSVLLRAGHDENDRKEFLDYAAAMGRTFPQKIRIFRTGMFPLELDQITVQPQSVTEDMFKAPENAVELESCDNQQPPKPTRTPEPDFPLTAPHESGNFVTLLTLLITKEGKVGYAYVLNPDQYGFSSNAEKTVRTWQFKPATCQGKPVAMEMNVEVSFNRH